MELTTTPNAFLPIFMLFMMSKIQNLNGTHNLFFSSSLSLIVVYDVKDTKFEWNSQQLFATPYSTTVVYDVKDTKFEWNSQHSEQISELFISCL